MKTAIYARVSTNEQSPEMQLTTLREYCKARGFEVYKEYVDTGFSGSKDGRPALNELVADAKKRKFDAVLVFKLDRYFRSAKHLLIALEEFKALGIEFVSYTETFDTTTPLGKAIFIIVGAISELEKNLIRERVIYGLKNAKAKGKRLGRPTVDYDPRKIWFLKEQGLSLRDIAKEVGVSVATVFRVLQNPAGKEVVNS